MIGETKNRWGVFAALLLAMTMSLSGCGGFGETGSPPANQGGGDSAEDSGENGGDTSTGQGGQGQTPPGDNTQGAQAPPEDQQGGQGQAPPGNDSQNGQTPGGGSGNGTPGQNGDQGGGQDGDQNGGNDTGAVTSEELVADMETAQKITDQFWQTHWSEFFTGSYTPPTVVGMYDGRDASSAPTCGGKPLEAENAFYCPSEDYVAWDVSLMARGFQFGDAWPYLVIAHEWGHAIANRLDASLQYQAYELQADCLAGATLYGAAQDGTIQFEEGDQNELVTSLSSLGGDTPWTDPEDHGDSFERVDNFNVGRTSGVLACFPSQQ